MSTTKDKSQGPYTVQPHSAQSLKMFPSVKGPTYEETLFDSEEEANDLADALNAAYQAGQADRDKIDKSGEGEVVAWMDEHLWECRCNRCNHTMRWDATKRVDLDGGDYESDYESGCEKCGDTNLMERLPLEVDEVRDLLMKSPLFRPQHPTPPSPDKSSEVMGPGMLLTDEEIALNSLRDTYIDHNLPDKAIAEIGALAALRYAHDNGYLAPAKAPAEVAPSPQAVTVEGIMGVIEPFVRHRWPDTSHMSQTLSDLRTRLDQYLNSR